MRILLLIVATLGVLLAAGVWLIPLLFNHASGLIGGLGAVLLLVALLLPRKRKCVGFHCPDCQNH